MSGENVAVWPGITVFDWSAAAGFAGGVTVGVIVVDDVSPFASLTWYDTGVAAVVPLTAKPGSGSKVTVPPELTV
jgi:hypothetical protein